MFPHPAIFAINHLLASEDWARERLAPFAGKHVSIAAPPLPELKLRVLAGGLVGAADASAQDDLAITVKSGALPHLASRDEALLQHVEIKGNAELANAVQFLFRNLKWDVEDDLSKIFGDIAARRMAQVGRDIAAWQQDAALRAGQNFAEYLTEEQPLIARAADVERFNRDVEALRDDLARLEARLARLTGR
jgi:ubiquinone biosynthesis protein UbiJ